MAMIALIRCTVYTLRIWLASSVKYYSKSDSEHLKFIILLRARPRPPVIVHIQHTTHGVAHSCSQASQCKQHRVRPGNKTVGATPKR